jgi:hypothetical protein
MKIETIDDAYRLNAAAIEKLRSAVGGISSEDAAAVPPGETWSLDQLVEHVALVDDGIARICNKLLSQAESEGRSGDGRCTLSASFLEGTKAAIDEKLAAPDRVQPSGQQSIAESFAKIDETTATLDQMRSRFLRFDGSAATFPHPYFGDLSANDWLVLRGGHIGRHLRQINARRSEATGT